MLKLVFESLQNFQIFLKINLFKKKKITVFVTTWEPKKKKEHLFVQKAKTQGLNKKGLTRQLNKQKRDQRRIFKQLPVISSYIFIGLYQ